MFVLTAIGVVCTIALTTTTLLVNVPINSEIINTWSVNNPPADWAQVRDRWNLFHAIRTVLAVVALLCLLLAAMIPQATQYPSRDGNFGSGKERT